MKKTLIIGLLVMAILISGCVSTTPTPTPTMTTTPVATITETAQPTMTATPVATITETVQPTITATSAATMTTTAQPTNVASVDIKNFAFVPPTITVTNGTTVTWTNDDSVQHTVTSATGAFDSGNIDPGATYSYTFNQIGSFNYGCMIHTTMQGTVIVTQ